MTTPQQIAKHLREVYVGDNWTSVSLKDALTDVSWEEAVTKVFDLNTIAALVFHVNYYIPPVLKVLKGEPLVASDKLSFDLPLISSEDDWQQLVSRVYADAENFAAQIEALDESKMFQDFSDGKHGNYYRNIVGIIEHTYYHIGQIVLIKKILKHK